MGLICDYRFVLTITTCTGEREEGNRLEGVINPPGGFGVFVVPPSVSVKINLVGKIFYSL
jgi:hypothetical protein